ncbi:unannotated protein [freshwater metagenome]|uniref:Unannotated protein n=1 Tax=freshwater metagenome TaxID=449393 RepID=A0A6J7CIW6_9ZZZZ
MALGPLGNGNLGRERLQIFDSLDAKVAEPAHEAVEDVGRGACVVEGTMGRRNGRIEVGRERAELAVADLAPLQCHAGDARGI